MMNRKAFLKYSGILGVSAVVAGVKLPRESTRFNRDLYKVSNTRNMMGTWVSLTVMHASKTKAEDAIERAFDDMERSSQLLTRFDSRSAVSVLNRDGTLSYPPVELRDVLVRSHYYHNLSGGAFDITVKPLLELYEESFDAWGGPPDAGRIREVMQRIDGTAIASSRNSVGFSKDGLSITLDGIAKGYVVDRGADTLNRLGIQNALINAGGDIRVLGGKNQSTGWRIAVQNPRKQGPYLDWISLKDGAVATSGNYEVYYDTEKLYHHILNPMDGMSPPNVASVSVRAPTVMDADALSTTVFILGAKDGTRFISRIPGTASLVVESNGRKTKSAGWRSA